MLQISEIVKKPKKCLTCSTRISIMTSLPARPSPYLQTVDASHTVNKKAFIN